MTQHSQINKVIPPLNDCDHIRGSTNAAIVLMEYGSYQCPQSGQAYFTVKELQQRLMTGVTTLEENPLCFVFRHFPMSEIYLQAQKAAEVAEAAATQGKFWQMHDTLFEHQQALDDAALVEYAIQLDLDIPQFLQELADHIHAERVEADINSGRSNGVEETPTFFILLDPITHLIREGPASFLLSLVAGFVDTAGFIALFGLFTAHVTGNLLLAGASIIQSDKSGVISRLVMIPVFMASIALTSLVARLARHHGRSVLSILLTIETLALGVFMLVGVAMEPALSLPEHETAVIIVGATGVTAMGIQNALMREAASNLPPTTVMTGNLTQFTIDLLQSLNWSQPQPPTEHSESEVAKARHRMARYAPTLIGFVLGAAFGAYGVAQFRFWSILIPVVITGLMSLAIVRAQHFSPPLEKALK